METKLGVLQEQGDYNLFSSFNEEEQKKAVEQQMRQQQQQRRNQPVNEDFHVGQ